MSKSTYLATTALIAVTISTGAQWLGADSRTARLDSIEFELGRIEASPTTPKDGGEVSAQLARLAERIATLEAREPRVAIQPPPQTSPDQETAPAAPPTASAKQRTELDRLVARLNSSDFDWQGEELGQFMELVRESDVLDRAIAELEASVEASPNDTGSRMDLANFYIGKLFTSQGPEQGVWAGRAEKQWFAVRDLDPDNWQSRFRIGNSYAYYPDVMGKTDDAIAMLTEAREVQERSPPAAGHVQTYLSLARMHQRKGNHDQAREVLNAGLYLHPGHAGLADAVAKAK